MTLAIYNGASYVDLMPYVIPTSISYNRSYVEGANKMTMQNGNRFPDRIRDVEPITFSFRPLTTAEQAMILSLLNPAGVTMQYTARATGMTATWIFYPGELPSTYLVKRQNGVEWYGGLSVTMEPR